MTFDARHMEMALVGWAITWPDRFYEIQELREIHFTHTGCQKVFDTMRRLYMEHGAGSIQSASLIARHLVREGMSEADAFAFLTECADNAPQGVEAGASIRKEIAEQAMRRSLTAASGQLAALATDSQGSTDEVADEASKIILEAVSTGADVQVADMRTEMQEEIERMEAAARGEYHQARGYPTGLSALDHIIGGLHNGEMIVIGARPSVGKTALLGSIAANLLLEQKLPGVIFTMEMRRGEYAARMISHTSEVDLQKAMSRLLNPTELKAYTAHAKVWAETPWFLHDHGGVTLAKLGAVTRRLYHEFGIKWVGIDYLQLMDHQHRKQESDNSAVTRTSKGIKTLALSLNIPIIALAQLNRDCERRDNKRPRLQDLRDSGCLSGDATVYLPETGYTATMRDLAARVTVPRVATVSERKVRQGRCVGAFSSGRKPVFELTTGSGRSIKATGNHKFLTPAGWKPLEMLSPGDRIAVPAYLPTSSAVRRTMSLDRLALLGHLIGNGCVLPHHCVQYTTADADLAKMVARLAERVTRSHDRPVKARISPERTWIQVYLAAAGMTRGKRNPITEWFCELGIFGLRSFEKRVPLQVFGQDERGIAWFLKHLFTTDGTSGRRTRPPRGQGIIDRGRTDIATIGYSTSSPVLAEQVHELLLRLGINSAVREVKYKLSTRLGYQVWITGLEGRRRFVRKVGMAGRRKAATLRRVASLIDTQGEGRTLDGDIYWDRVKSIQPGGVEEVFDLTVPGTQNFVANNIVVHNSIEQDSDVVAFLYRESMYAKPGEAPSSSPFEPAEIIVAKQRNGPVGTARVAFKNSCARFSNVPEGMNMDAKDGEWTPDGGDGW